MTRERRGAAVAEWFYRCLLRLYPRRFRREVGGRMVEAFVDQWEAAVRERGLRTVPGLCLRATWDALRNGLAERLWPSREMGSTRTSPQRTVTTHPGLAVPTAGKRKARRTGSDLMTTTLHSLEEAWRQLARRPAMTLIAVVALSVGIGAFASIFSVVDALLLEPMPYEEPDELVYVWRDYPWMNFPRGWAGGVEVLAMRERGTVFEGITVIRAGNANLSGRGERAPEEIRVMLTSANFFDVLGVQPMIGRGFLPGEDEPGAPSVAVIEHSLWQQRYGGDADVVGRDVLLDGEPARVVGVLPPGFEFARHSSLGSPITAPVYVPLQIDLAQITGGSLAVIARRKPGVDREQLQAQLEVVASEVDEQYFGDKGLRLWAVGLKEDLVEDIRPALIALTVSALFILAILAANLATLFLGRSIQRQQELAIRAALGAGRWALFGELVLEGLLLGLAGGAVGALLAVWGTDILVALAPPDLPRQGAVGVDATVVGASLALGALLGFLAAVPPAIRAARAGLGAALQEAAVRGEVAAAGRVRNGLVVAQVALSVVLLAGAVVLGRGFVDLLRVDPGFEPTGVLTARIPLAGFDLPDDAPEVVATFERLRDRIAALPGVTDVGAGESLPLVPQASQNGVRFPGAPGNTGDPDEDTPLVDLMPVMPGTFDALGVELLAGRRFSRSDDAEAPPVVVIDDTLARRFFPNDDAVGRTAELGGEVRSIVGVVDQPRLYNVHSDDRGQVYLPLGQAPQTSLYFAIRTTRGPRSLIPELRRVVSELHPDVPVSRVRTMEQIVSESVREERLSLSLIAGFALGALLLASLGLYGVVSSSVVRRTREVGVRMALGADAGRVLRMVVMQGMRLTALGLVLGLAGALVATRFLEGLIHGLEPRDPVALAAVVAVLALVALAASWLPARRATRIDPMVALRAN